LDGSNVSVQELYVALPLATAMCSRFVSLSMQTLVNGASLPEPAVA
jgi:hypothetical protein